MGQHIVGYRISNQGVERLEWVSHDAPKVLEACRQFTHDAQYAFSREDLEYSGGQVWQHLLAPLGEMPLLEDCNIVFSLPPELAAMPIHSLPIPSTEKLLFETAHVACVPSLNFVCNPWSKPWAVGVDTWKAVAIVTEAGLASNEHYGPLTGLAKAWSAVGDWSPNQSTKRVTYRVVGERNYTHAALLDSIASAVDSAEIVEFVGHQFFVEGAQERSGILIGEHNALPRLLRGEDFAFCIPEGVQLAVMVTCGSATGVPVSNTEFVSLERGVLDAGVPRVVTSLTLISDVEARAFIDSMAQLQLRPIQAYTVALRELIAKKRPIALAACWRYAGIP